MVQQHQKLDSEDGSEGPGRAGDGLGCLKACDHQCAIYIYIIHLLYAKVRFHILSAQYSAFSIAVEFVMWMSAVVQVWFSFSQRSRCCIVCRSPHE